MTAPFRFSCTSFSFPLLELPDVARVLQALEFRHIDLCIADGERDVVAAAVEADPEGKAAADRLTCDRAGLGVVDVFCHLGHSAFDRPINTSDPAQQTENRTRFRAYLRYAAVVGAEGLTVSPGKHWEAHPDEGFELACRELSRYVAWASDAGLRLSVEPHVDSVASTPHDAHSLVNAVPGLTLTVDYSHFVALGISQEDVHPLLPYAGHLHARQAARGKLQAAEDEGRIRFDEILTELNRLRYQGALALEYLWSPWKGMNRVDVVTETLLLRRRLQARIEALSPTVSMQQAITTEQHR